MSTIQPNTSLISEADKMREDINQLQDVTLEIIKSKNKSDEMTTRGFKAIKDALELHKKRADKITENLQLQSNTTDKILDELDELGDLIFDLMDDYGRLYIKFIIVAGLVLVEAVLLAVICVNGGL